MMTMPPSAHTLAPMMTTMPQQTKPKIGFSIDSIVGNRNTQNKSPINFSHDSEGSEAPLSPLSDYGYHQQTSPRNDLATAIKLNEYAQLELRNKLKRSLSTSPQPVANKQRLVEHENDLQRHEMQKSHDPQSRLMSDDNAPRSPQSPVSPHMQKTPIIVPGIPASILRPHGPPGGLQAEMMAAQNPFFRLVISLSLPT